MYRISYEKCVCFIFLVILAILSCSGFRIDNLAMTDISKRNFLTSSSFSNSDEFFDRIFNVRSSVETITPAYRHKIRHHRQLRAQVHNSHRRYESQKLPTGHIDVQVFPPRAAGFLPTTHPSEHFAQIPSTDIHHPLFPTRPIVTRSQRSSDHKRKQKQEFKSSSWQRSQEEDVSLKAFKAEIVVLAQAESGSTIQCVFKVNTTYKNTKQFSVNDRILLKMACDKEEKSHKSQNLVKNKIQLGKSYILFLNASNAHNYWSVGVPKMIRPVKKARIEKVINQVCKTKFVPTTPKIVELREVSRKKSEKRKLLCKVGGFPVPTISWRRKGEILHQNQFFRIQYRRKQSRLIIRKMDADSYGRYECIAEGANGEVVFKAITVSDPSLAFSETFSSGKECDAPLRTSYCHNGGTCHKEVTMGEYYCICAPGYSGIQCEIKEPSLSSMYQPAIYTCKLGLSTKFYC